MLSRLAMKVSRLSPTDGTGVGAEVSRAWLALRNGVWILTMFWQNWAGLLSALFAGEIAGWPTLDRYRLVFATLNALPTATISSVSGTSAIGAAWFLAAESSFSACDVLGVPACDKSGALKGVQPSAGSMNASSRALSLP